MSEPRSTQSSTDTNSTPPLHGPELANEVDSLMTRLGTSEEPAPFNQETHSTAPPSNDEASPVVIKRARIISVGGPISAFVAPSTPPPALSSRPPPITTPDEPAHLETEPHSLTVDIETLPHEEEAPVLSVDSVPILFATEESILNADDVVEEVTSPELRISTVLANLESASTQPEDLTTVVPPPLPSTKPVVESTGTTSQDSSPSSVATSEVVSSESKPKKRPWFDDFFNDDYLRTLPQVKPSFIAREVKFIETSLSCQQGATILDLCCGDGQHATMLAQLGYTVVGVDLSLSMLTRAADEASAKGLHLSWIHSDMRELDFKETYDGVYCWGTSFGYFEESKNIEVIQKIQHSLRRGGRFLLDVVNRDYVMIRSPSMVWFEGDGCVCMDESTLNNITSRLSVKRTMMFEDGRQRELEYSIRLYSLHELGKMLHDAGFRIIEASGDVSTPGVHFGAESPHILILAEKR